MEIDFHKLEDKIIKFWKINKIFEKSIERRKKAPNFVFYEGPPTANGKPGIHHLEARAFKDIICRYKTMQGYKVLRKAGWDTHGLPVELQTEKELGLRDKKDIEKFGIANFNQKCKESVWRYKKNWEDLTEKIGYWLDMEKPYITYQNDYIETVWWILKKIWDKNLLYQDYKVVPYCPRCGTSLSSHEVAQGYKKIAEPAIFLKLQITNYKSQSYLLVWTTTPWTLPGNVAVAVNPKINYVKVKKDKEYLILAKERLKQSGLDAEIVEEFKGKKLLGLKYRPLYKNKAPYKVIAGDFVTMEEGTGLVHIAPAFGEDDMNAGKKNNLPVLVTVDQQGNMVTPGYKWNNLFVKTADSLIIEDLKKRNILFKEELYEHDYPFCWRCKTPLIYYAKKSWFIKTTEVKNDLIKNNQKINWLPQHLKEGRFGEWLKDLKDWAISRERYWGTPLPVWQCSKCHHQECLGSREDLLKQKFSTNHYFVLRHGETECFKKGILNFKDRGANCPLTGRGHEQIKKVAEKMKKEKIDLVFSSDFFRTRQTAEIISQELKIKINYDERLREVNLGVFHGQNIKKYWQNWQSRLEKFKERPPQGESYLEVKKRMADFIKEIDKKYKNKNILIISHGGPIWMLEILMKGLSDKESLDYWQKKAINVSELREIEFKNLSYNNDLDLDFHRPYLDQVEFLCPECQSLMKRVPEVIDCWFDSGAMPFAQGHWPFAQGSAKPPELFPADYISEAVDQTRGWFYTLLAISTLLGFSSPYKNVISLGHVLDEKGEKMSKSKGNVVDPWQIIEKYSSEATRWYFYTINQPGDAKLFTEKDVEQALRKFILTYYNVFSFFELYRNEIPNTKFQIPIKSQAPNPKHILDKWILSRLNSLILGATDKLDNYDIVAAAREIEDFVINDLSLWYVRRSRKRFQEAADTLQFVLLTLSKLTAPFVPFISEEIYDKFQIPNSKSQSNPKHQTPNSVHLEDWPKANKKLINKKLEEKMKLVREIVAEGLNQRAKAGIKTRQPLSRLEINKKMEKDFLGLIKEEVNVKEIEFGKETKLDTEITPILKEEGLTREMLRHIQEMRKKAGYRPQDKILIRYSGDDYLKGILKRNKELNLQEGERPKEVFDIESNFKIDGKDFWLGIRKI